MPTAARRRRHTACLVERGYRAILADASATPDQKLRAADGLSRIQGRKDRAEAKAAAAEPELPQPAPTCSPEEWEAVEAELARRDAAHKADQHAAISARKAYFDSHPDRAGEVMNAIGPKEFLRITTVPE